MHSNRQSENASRSNTENYHISAHLCKCRGPRAKSLQSPFSMHQVFQLLKMSNCFDSKRKDVIEKSAECLKQRLRLQLLCSTADLGALRHVCHRACYDTRERAEFGPSVARCHSSSDAAAGCPSLFCVPHISAFRTHS